VNQVDDAHSNSLVENTTAVSSVRANGYQEAHHLQPFTHAAKIPAASDASTIRFEKAKLVQVPTRVTYTMDPKSCEGLVLGSSMYCPDTRVGAPAAAYQVTYSYIGPPLASDEFAGRNFTFDVYFRVDELPAPVKEALTRRTQNRANLAENFTVSTLREPVQQVVIDEVRSHFCAGNYLDGTWTHSDAGCMDEIFTKALIRPDDYLTVTVEPISAQPHAALQSAIRHENCF
jgi:hypothetical protein